MLCSFLSFIIHRIELISSSTRTVHLNANSVSFLFEANEDIHTSADQLLKSATEHSIKARARPHRAEPSTQLESTDEIVGRERASKHTNNQQIIGYIHSSQHHRHNVRNME